MLILLWNRRTPQPKAYPTQEILGQKWHSGHFCPQRNNFWWGLGLILYRKQTARKASQTKFSANTLITKKFSKYEGMRDGEKTRSPRFFLHRVEAARAQFFFLPSVCKTAVDRYRYVVSAFWKLLCSSSLDYQVYPYVTHACCRVVLIAQQQASCPVLVYVPVLLCTVFFHTWHRSWSRSSIS